MGEAFRDRLRRLRREQRSPALAPGPAPEPLPSWLRHRLARPAPGTAEADDGSPCRPRTAGLPADLAILSGPRGEYAARDTLLATSELHGDFALDEARRALPQAFELLTRGSLRGELDIARAVFLDIETTGLCGGAGVHTFLVGLGWFEGEQFRVRQAFLRGFDEEPALMAACAERIREGSGLVSFFGKSFDRHRLEDKMRLHGVRPPFDGLPHLDLYWPCRRLYGSATRDSRLATMEQVLCGVERERDLPGSFAPAAWFDYLSGRGHLLEQVFRHNLLDVLSLVALSAHLGRAPVEERADGRPLWVAPELAASRASALAALHDKNRDARLALEWLDRALERNQDEATVKTLTSRRERVLARWARQARRVEPEGSTR